MTQRLEDSGGFKLRASPLLTCFILILGLCPNGDFGRIKSSLVIDDIHSWVGPEASRQNGGPWSVFPLTEDERQLRDLAYPLIEPPYDRQKFYSILGEYGVGRFFHKDWWYFDRGAYATKLMWQPVRSATGRYEQLIEDVRNDIVRIDGFFMTGRRVLDADRKREKSLAYVSDLSPPELFNARARIFENAMVIGWVQRSLEERALSYRFALERLVIMTPAQLAIEGERSIDLMKFQLAKNILVAPPSIVAVGPVPGKVLVTKP